MSVAGAAHRLGEDVHLERLLAAIGLRHAGDADVGALLDVGERGLDQRDHHRVVRQLDLQLARRCAVLTTYVSPSTRSIVPRTRTGGSCAGYRRHRREQQCDRSKNARKVPRTCPPPIGRHQNMDVRGATLIPQGTDHVKFATTSGPLTYDAACS